MAPAGAGNIKVVVRVRPFNSRGEWWQLEQLKQKKKKKKNKRKR